MRIILITPLLPFPDDDGAKAIALSNIRALLALGADITLVTFIEKKNDTVNRSRLLKMGVKRIVLFYNPKIGESRRPVLILGFLKSLFSTKTFQMTKYWIPEMSVKINELIKLHRYDALWINFALMAQYCPRGFSGKLIFSNLCIDSVIHRQIFTHSRFLRLKIDALFDWIKYALTEKNIYRKFDLVFQVSLNDARYLKRKFCLDNVFHLPISVPLPTLKSPKRDKNVLLFIGKLLWAPNRDGFSWFVSSVLLQIRKRVPDVRLWVLGKPSSSYKNRQNSFAGVTFLGHRHSYGDILEKASVSVNPVRYGTGIKMKLFTAMAAGLPVVTMPEGLNRMPVKNKREMLIAKNGKDFVNKIIYALKNTGQMNIISQNALKYISRYHSLDLVTEILRKNLKL